jgi:hypothetical protein
LAGILAWMAKGSLVAAAVEVPQGIKVDLDTRLAAAADDHGFLAHDGAGERDKPEDGCDHEPRGCSGRSWAPLRNVAP